MGTTFVFCSFAIHPADIEGRQGTDFTIILTAVAFKLVLQDMLPAVSYITRLDRYIFGCFGVLTVVTGYHTIFPHLFFSQTDMSVLTRPPLSIGGEDDLVDTDFMCFKALLGIWIAFNVLFWLVFYAKSNSEHARFIEETKKQQSDLRKVGASKSNHVMSPKAGPKGEVEIMSC